VLQHQCCAIEGIEKIVPKGYKATNPTCKSRIASSFDAVLICGTIPPRTQTLPG
jgi:hypothetical protein